MNKIKQQLILYHPYRYLDNPGACIKKHLYLPSFEFCEARESFAQVKKIYKARISKYIRRTHWNLIEVLQRKTFSINTFNFFVSNLTLSQISVQGETILNKFSEEEQRFTKRIFSRQKRLSKCQLELYTGTLAEDRIKALFQIRSLKKFELKIIESTEKDLVLLECFLQNLQKRRKSLTTRESQKIKLELLLLENDDYDLNEFLVEYFEKLLELKYLLKETCTQLALSFDLTNLEDDEVKAETWTLLAKIMKKIGNIVEVQYLGEPKKSFAIALKGLKDLKELKRLHFEFDNIRCFEDIFWESFGSIGDSLADFSMKIHKLEYNKDWVKKLQARPRLESLCLSSLFIKFDQSFFVQLSDCLNLMTNLQDLRIELTFNMSILANGKVPNVKQLLEAIGGQVKLKNLGLLLTCHFGKMVVDGMKCEQLMNLKSLRTLNYTFFPSKTRDDEMKQLLVVLSQMNDLEELSLRFSVYENLEDQNLISIFRVIAGMKWLRTVNIEFGCSNVRNEFMGVFFEVVMGLRYLEEAELRICQTSHNTKLERSLKDVCKRVEIEKKIPIRMIIWEGSEVEKKKKKKVRVGISLLIIVSFCVLLLSYFMSYKMT